MRPIFLIPVSLLVLVLLNGAWFYLYEPPLVSQVAEDGSTEWEPLPEWQEVKPGLSEKLLAGGRWGEVQQPEAEEGVPEPRESLPEGELTAAEEKDLLGRLQGIIIRDGKRAIFSATPDSAEGPVSVAEGEPIPGTRWQVVAISRDRLSLTAYQPKDGGQEKDARVELRLYKVSGQPVETPNEQ